MEPAPVLMSHAGFDARDRNPVTLEFQHPLLHGEWKRTLRKGIRHNVVVMVVVVELFFMQQKYEHKQQDGSNHNHFSLLSPTSFNTVNPLLLFLGARQRRVSVNFYYFHITVVFFRRCGGGSTPLGGCCRGWMGGAFEESLKS